ncbi:MAG: hypothetical protein AAB781_00325 [Patescibacteria group bacterium]
MYTHHKSRIIARFGILFLFLTFGIWEIIDPNYWIGFAPSLVAKSAGALLLVKIHGIILSIVGAGIFFSKHVKFFAFFATVIMVQIVVFLWLASGFTDLLVRDTAILIFAASLMF